MRKREDMLIDLKNQIKRYWNKTASNFVNSSMIISLKCGYENNKFYYNFQIQSAYIFIYFFNVSDV